MLTQHALSRNTQAISGFARGLTVTLEDLPKLAKKYPKDTDRLICTLNGLQELISSKLDSLVGELK